VLSAPILFSVIHCACWFVLYFCVVGTAVGDMHLATRQCHVGLAGCNIELSTFAMVLFDCVRVDDVKPVYKVLLV